MISSCHRTHFCDFCLVRCKEIPNRNLIPWTRTVRINALLKLRPYDQFKGKVVYSKIVGLKNIQIYAVLPDPLVASSHRIMGCWSSVELAPMAVWALQDGGGRVSDPYLILSYSFTVQVRGYCPKYVFFIAHFSENYLSKFYKYIT